MARMRFAVEGVTLRAIIRFGGGVESTTSLALKEAEEMHAELGGKISEMRANARRSEAGRAGVTFQNDGTEEGQR
jgi:hypothetical protein